MRIAVLILLFVLGQPLPRPGELPGAGSITSAGTGESHGWVVYPVKDGAVVQHLPPRGRDSAGKPGVADGSIRVATTLAQMPVAMAAIENRVYLVFAPTSAGAGREPKRPVLMVEAQRRSVDGDWVGEAEGERLPSAPGIPGTGKLLGFASAAGAGGGPWALMLVDGGARLLRLMGEEWVEVPLPSRDMEGELELIGTGTGVGIVQRGGSSGVWQAEVKPVRGRGSGEAGRQASAPVGWAWRPLKFVDRETGSGIGAGRVLWVRDRVLCVTREQERIEVRDVTERGASRIATVSGVTRDFAVVPLDQTGRVAVVWRERDGTRSQKEPVERVMIAEVSAQTGQVLYEGEAQPRRPFSAMELRLLAAFLVVVMLAIVVFVLRPDAQALPGSLPEGMLLAEPGRRVFAAMLDTVLAVLVASQVTGIRPSALLNMQVLMTQPDAMTLYLASIAVGAALGAISELVFGATFGKALTGIEVVRPVFLKSESGEVRLQLRRVSVWRAVVRNIVKWVLPPVAMSGLSTPDRRHRGDLAAGTIVVSRGNPGRKD